VAGARLSVRVMPRASRNEIAGLRDGVLIVRVTAPPEGGKANSAVAEVIAAALGVPKSAVALVRGASSRAKLVEIAGASQEDIDELLRTQAARE
jgi:uncharacterized protein